MWLLLFFASYWSSPDVQTYEVQIKQTSTIRVEGKTNINKFNCRYEKDLQQKPLEVEVKKVGHRIYLKGAHLRVFVDQLDCVIPMMTKDMKKLLKHEQHPYITVKVQELNTRGPNLYASTKLTIAGVSRPYRVPIHQAEKQDSQSMCRGYMKLNIRDFDLEPPVKLLGAVRVKEEIGIRFELNLKIVHKSTK